jgi:hypothetical protein
MSLESRIQVLERKRSYEDDEHIHWMIPNASGGASSPNPKDCKICVESDFKNHYTILFNLRSGKPLELNHVRR